MSLVTGERWGAEEGELGKDPMPFLLRDASTWAMKNLAGRVYEFCSGYGK